MSRPTETLWEIERHTLAKHEILRRYLGAWFAILGSKFSRIMYLDGFCGPGRYKGGEDGSPIIALQEAKKQKNLKKKDVFFLFIDENQDRIRYLQTEIANFEIPNNFEVRIHEAQFHDTLSKLLDEIKKQGKQLMPTFAFIDPFGFKGIPFNLVERLLAVPSTEVFINVMLDSINRFVEHPDSNTQQHIIDMFGTNEVLDVIKSGENRFAVLRFLYQEQLQKHAKFVRFFEMRDYHNRIIYCLFFASNHPLGHVKMKETFWEIDPSSGFKFSDRTNPNQQVLFEIDPSNDLADDLIKLFASQTVQSEIVIKHVEDQTPYIAKHGRNALKKLEQGKKIIVNQYKIDGKKRIRNTFPRGTVIKFS